MERPRRFDTDPNEHLSHLAHVAQVPESTAREIYEEELHSLERDARVKAFLPAIALRHARDRLLHS